jgi:hypothetical protein
MLVQEHLLAEIERIARWIGTACRAGWPPYQYAAGRLLDYSAHPSLRSAINWRLTALEASIKPKNLYPSINA